MITYMKQNEQKFTQKSPIYFTHLNTTHKANQQTQVPIFHDKHKPYHENNYENPDVIICPYGKYTSSGSQYQIGQEHS